MVLRAPSSTATSVFGPQGKVTLSRVPPGARKRPIFSRGLDAGRGQEILCACTASSTLSFLGIKELILSIPHHAGLSMRCSYRIPRTLALIPILDLYRTAPGARRLSSRLHRAKVQHLLALRPINPENIQGSLRYDPFPFFSFDRCHMLGGRVGIAQLSRLWTFYSCFIYRTVIVPVFVVTTCQIAQLEYTPTL